MNIWFTSTAKPINGHLSRTNRARQYQKVGGRKSSQVPWRHAVNQRQVRAYSTEATRQPGSCAKQQTGSEALLTIIGVGILPYLWFLFLLRLIEASSTPITQLDANSFWSPVPPTHVIPTIFWAGRPSCCNLPNLSCLGTGTERCWTAFPIPLSWIKHH